MKSIKLLALVAIVAFGMASCKKCKDCSSTTKYIFDGIDDEETEFMMNALGAEVTTSPQEYCGDDLKEVDGKEFEVTTSMMGISYKVVTTWNCK